MIPSSAIKSKKSSAGLFFGSLTLTEPYENNLALGLIKSQAKRIDKLFSEKTSA